MVYSYKRLSFVAILIILAAGVFSTCVQPSAGTDLRGEAYAGSASCQKCHQAVCNIYAHAAHSQTSAAGDKNSVKGSFAAGANRYVYKPGMEVVMEARDSGLFQVATTAGEGSGAGDAATAAGGAAVKKEAHRFDVVMGSGRKAQTYLYWVGDQAFELPISYFVTTHSWANSPGFPTDYIKFGRTIPVLCFQCHSSFIQQKPPIRVDAFNQIDQFDKTQVIYGIDCERCHGPAAKHVAWQEEHPQDHTANYIARVTTLSRQQKLDMCALCHSGSHKMQLSAFGFKPGDRLSNYYYPESRIAATPANMDVHGNQYQLLMASQCMLKSKTLDCTGCHDPHKKERDNLALFSQRCMSCHQPDSAGHAGGSGYAAVDAHRPAGVSTSADTHRSAGAGASTSADRRMAGTDSVARFCRLAVSLGTAVLAANCIDCHMPDQSSKIITLQTEGQKDPVADKVRSHYIAIYPEETKKFLAAMKH